jgi:hypothetical protein
MELKERAETARARFEELHDSWNINGGLSVKEEGEYEWLKTEIQLLQAEAFTRLAYKSW